jgi:predicted nicotinamide N-methyase
LIAQPKEPDRLLDDPTVLAASKSNDYMPYWAYLWPGATLLASYIVSHEMPPAARVLEIGCGLGLAGLAALASGSRVTFSDYSPAALAMAEHNARLNGFVHFTTQIIDWNDPPSEQYGRILGADVLYEGPCVTGVLRVLRSMLAPGGEAWLSDPGRSVADSFVELARNQGYTADALLVQSGRIFRVFA